MCKSSKLPSKEGKEETQHWLPFNMPTAPADTPKYPQPKQNQATSLVPGSRKKGGKEATQPIDKHAAFEAYEKNSNSNLHSANSMKSIKASSRGQVSQVVSCWHALDDNVNTKLRQGQPLRMNKLRMIERASSPLPDCNLHDEKNIPHDAQHCKQSKTQHAM